MRKKVHDKLAYLIKHNQFVQLLYRVVMSACIRFIGIFVRTDDKLVLLSSYGGKQYSDSPRVLYEAMQKDERFIDYHYIWAFEQPNNYNLENAKSVKIDSLLYFIYALKAKIWITNVNIERGLNFKKKETIYLNTWHGTGPKKSGNAVKGRKDYDFSQVDIFCCDGEYLHDIFIKHFKAKEESMLWCGRPREDELVNFSEKDRVYIRRKLNIPEYKKVILYMPTWREYENQALNTAFWEQMLGEDYLVLVRAHHFTAQMLTSKESFLWRDVTDYPSVNELYCAADILISDYSSSFWDYALLTKPMFCFAYDYERYCESTGLLLDMKKEFPNGILRTEKELIRTIKAMNYQEECEKTKAFCKRYVSHPVNATECCINRIYEMISYNEKGEKNDTAKENRHRRSKSSRARFANKICSLL